MAAGTSSPETQADEDALSSDEANLDSLTKQISEVNQQMKDVVAAVWAKHVGDA
jgi:hypothetical protein